MRLKSMILAAGIILCMAKAGAHATWIETNATGTKGIAQEVKIFFGEFSEKSISPAAHWFSDLKDFELLLIAPDKSETRLSSVMNTSYYAATFTPAADGVYTLILHHTVKDTYMNMKIDYNSSATVVVGNAVKGNDAAYNKNMVSIFSDSAFAATQNAPIKFCSFYDGKPAAKQKMKIVAPNGWEKEIYSNTKGETVFTALWQGQYMIEYAYVEKTPGLHNGQKYDEVWKIATYLVTVR